ncbi:MAG: hypothetical protein MH321_02840 [Leptospiraceae bacterium]|nr:hypothetical protein [Leptospiraceae bacterium]
MDDELISLIIGLWSWTFILGIVFVYIHFFSSKKLKIKKNPSTNLLEVFIGKDKIADLNSMIIQEIKLSKYSNSYSKSRSTNYTYSLIFNDNIIGQIRSKFPMIDKMEMDSLNLGFRIETSPDSIKIRTRAEQLSKSTGIPLRSEDGILRQATELDLPYHEVMKGKVDLDSFPPRYKFGDPFEVSLDTNGLILKSHSINILMYIPVGFFLFIATMFFIASGSYELFYIENPDTIDIIFASIFNSHIFFALLLAIYIPYRIHFPKDLRINKGTLKYGRMSIPVSEIEEVHLQNFYCKIISDKKTYSIFLPFFCHLKDLKLGSDLIQKAIFYQGIR